MIFTKKKDPGKNYPDKKPVTPDGRTSKIGKKFPMIDVAVAEDEDDDVSLTSSVTSSNGGGNNNDAATKYQPKKLFSF
jgi:hypothetical protein